MPSFFNQSHFNRKQTTMNVSKNRQHKGKRNISKAQKMLELSDWTAVARKRKGKLTGPALMLNDAEFVVLIDRYNLMKYNAQDDKWSLILILPELPVVAGDPGDGTCGLMPLISRLGCCMSYPMEPVPPAHSHPSRRTMPCSCRSSWSSGTRPRRHEYPARFQLDDSHSVY